MSLSRHGMARYVSLVVIVLMMVSAIPTLCCASSSPATTTVMTEAVIGTQLPEKVDTSVIMVTFDTPQIEVIDGEAVVTIGDLQRLHDPCMPDMVYGITNLEFSPDFRLVDMVVEPGRVEEIQLPAPIRVQPDPLVITEGGPHPMKTHDIDPYDGSLYPEIWGKHYIARGLNDADQPTVFLNLFAFPARVQDNSLFFTNSITFTFKHYYAEPEVRPMDARAEEYRLVIIGPSSLSGPIGDLVDHKNGLDLPTRFVSTDDIYTGKYFTVQGSDDEEKIKYFIKNAMENWQTKFILLFGDVNQVPPFYVPYSDSYTSSVPTDLYYADIYGASGGFSDWDDAQGSTGSFTMPDDLYLDVHIARLPAETVSEANVVVDKVIHYENDKDKSSWFKTAVLIGSDPFSWASGYEGDIGMDFIADKIEDDFTTITKLYQSNNKNSATYITPEINNGAGIVTYAGHGMNTYLAIGGGKSYSTSNVASTTNGYKMAIASQAACLTGIYDAGTDSYAEYWVLDNGGGGIANMGASRVAYGSGGQTWPYAVAGAFNNRLYSSLVGGKTTAGSMYTGGHTNYMNTIGVNGGTDFKTVIEFAWFAEPSMEIGVSFDIFRNDDPGLLVPGEYNDFNITINNTGLALSAEFTTDEVQIPEGWEVTFVPQKVVVPSDRESKVKVRVKPDLKAQANTQFNLPLQVYGTALERILYTEVVPVKVAEIFDLALDTDYPTIGKNLDPGETLEVDLQVFNEGNTVENIDLELEGIPDGWVVSLSKDSLDLGFLQNQTVTLSVGVPDQCAPMTENILVKAKVLNDQTKTDDRLINVNVNTVHEWNMSKMSDDSTVDMGSTASFTIDLVNDGNVDEVIDLLLTGPPRWTLTYDKIVSIDPYSTRTVTVKVDVPEFEYVGNYSLQVTAENKATGDEKVIDLGVDVNPAPGFDLEVLDPMVQVAYMEGGEAGLSFENLGNTLLDIELEVSDIPEGWDHELSQTYVSLPAKESGFATVFFTNPEFTVSDNYTLKVLATATYGTFILTDDIEVTVNVGQYRNTTASIDQDKFQVDPGEALSIELLLDNMGNSPEDFTDISVVAPDMWTVTLGCDEMTVDPFSNTTVKAMLTVPDNALTGMYRATLFTKNDPSNFVFTMDIKVNQVYGFEGALSTTLFEMFIGEIELVQLNFTNLGNGEDVLTLVLTAEPWVLLDKNSVTMGPGDNGNVRLTVNPIVKTRPGDYPVSIKVTNEAGDEETYTFTVKVKEVPQTILGGAGGALWGILAVVLVIVVASIVAAVALARRRAAGRSSSMAVAQIPDERWAPRRTPTSDQTISLLDIDDLPDFPEHEDMFR